MPFFVVVFKLKGRAKFSSDNRKAENCVGNIETLL